MDSAMAHDRNLEGFEEVVTPAPVAEGLPRGGFTEVAAPAPAAAGGRFATVAEAAAVAVAAGLQRGGGW
jgi:hypothetical protein